LYTGITPDDAHIKKHFRAREIWERNMNERKWTSRDPDVLGGTPVFTGTRVPAQTLIDYLEGGHSLADFLDDFPTVDREQAIGVLESLKQVMLAQSV
jgi:uncharacterized protein (DUF433 family)